MKARSPDVYLGDWLFRPSESQVESTSGERVHLQPQEVAVLVGLLSTPGLTVTREALLAFAWGKVIVEEAGLTRCVSSLRAALGDNARHPKYIETVPKVGYRLIAKVQVGSTAGEAPKGPGAVRSRVPGRWLAAALLGLFAVLALVGVARVSSGIRSSTLSNEDLVRDGRLSTRRAGEHHRMAVKALGMLNLEAAFVAAEVVLAEDPQASEAMMLMAEVASARGQDEAAEGYSNSAISALPSLDGERARQLFARRALIRGDLVVAAEYFQRALASDPENLQYRCALAAVYGDQGAAARGLEVMGRNPPGVERSLRAELLRVRLLRMVGRLDEAVVAAQELDRRAAVAGAELAEAYSLLEEVRLRTFGGADDTAYSLLENSERMFLRLQDERGMASARLARSVLDDSGGDLEAATVHAQASLEQFQALGFRRGVAVAHRRLAESTRAREQGPAWESYEIALRLFDELGDERGKANTFSSWASVLATVNGDVTRAGDLLGAAEKLYRRLDGRRVDG